MMPYEFDEEQTGQLVNRLQGASDRNIDETELLLLAILLGITDLVAMRIQHGQPPIPLAADTVWRYELEDTQSKNDIASAILGYNMAAELMTSLGRKIPPVTDGNLYAQLMLNTVRAYTEEATRRQLNTIKRKIEATYRKYNTPDENGIARTPDEIAELVKMELEIFSKTYATILATTSTAWSLNEGMVKAYLKAGVTRWRWVTQKDDKVCPFCKELDGMIVNVTGYFVDANQELQAKRTNKAGEEVSVVFRAPAWPIQHPPLHNNCRCVLLPVD